MPSRLKELLKGEKLVRVFYLGQLCNPKMVEILALHEICDAVWFDHEHVGLTIEQIENSSRAARACGLDSFVRLAPTDYASVMRPLEAGSGGIMAAQVRSARQVEEIVQWTRFHPRGLRGVNSSGFDGAYGSLPLADYLRKANEDTFLAIQIEHVAAVEEVEAIAAIKDIDLLFIGPADLSQSMGIPGEWTNPRLLHAIERVGLASRRHGVPWGVLAFNPTFARKCVDLGCRLLSIGGDVGIIHKGLETLREDFKEFYKNKVSGSDSKKIEEPFQKIGEPFAGGSGGV